MGKVNKEGEEREEKRRMGDEREREKKNKKKRKKKKKKKKNRQFASIPADKKKQPKTQHQRDCSNNQHLYKSQ